MICITSIGEKSAPAINTCEIKHTWLTAYYSQKMNLGKLITHIVLKDRIYKI